MCKNLAHELHRVVDRLEQLVHLTHGRLEFEGSSPATHSINLHPKSSEVRGREAACCKICIFMIKVIGRHFNATKHCKKGNFVCSTTVDTRGNK